MADLAEIKARIQSVAETKKVTDAMYMISSVKMRRARREVEKTDPYFHALEEEIAEIFRHMPETSSRYFKIPRSEGGGPLRQGVLLVTSDKGLAGSYNQSAIGVCEEYLAQHPGTVLFIVGEYGRQHFAAGSVPFVSDFRYSAEQPTVRKAERICADILEYFNDGRVDVISVIYTDYISGRSSVCRRVVLLPLKTGRFASDSPDAEDGGSGEISEFYPDPDTVLAGIIPSYLTGFIYGCLVDSYCSEQQERMTAMNEAGRNAENMLAELKLIYNKARQDAITREMTEITSGARALAASAAQDRPAEEA